MPKRSRNASRSAEASRGGLDGDAMAESEVDLVWDVARGEDLTLVHSGAGAQDGPWRGLVAQAQSTFWDAREALLHTATRKKVLLGGLSGSVCIVLAVVGFRQTVYSNTHPWIKTASDGMARRGCENWAQIMLMPRIKDLTIDQCRAKCTMTRGCHQFNWQPGDCSGAGSAEAYSCYLFGPGCIQEQNHCWDLYNNTNPQPGWLIRSIRTGCENWREVKMGDPLRGINREQCAQKCHQESGCKQFGYQPGKCIGEQVDENSCYLFSGKCQEEINDCWDLYDLPAGDSSTEVVGQMSVQSTGSQTSVEDASKSAVAATLGVSPSTVSTKASMARRLTGIGRSLQEQLWKVTWIILSKDQAVIANVTTTWDAAASEPEKLAALESAVSQAFQAAGLTMAPGSVTAIETTEKNVALPVVDGSPEVAPGPDPTKAPAPTCGPDCNCPGGNCPGGCSGGNCPGAGGCSGGNCPGAGGCSGGNCPGAGGCPGGNCPGARGPAPAPAPPAAQPAAQPAVQPAAQPAAAPATPAAAPTDAASAASTTWQCPSPWYDSQYGEPTDQEAKAWTMAQNVFRCMHNAPANLWSNPVADDIKTYLADKTSMVHSDCYNVAPPAGPAGENLFMGTGSYTPGFATQSWYSEIDNPGCGNPGFPGCGPNGPVSGTGHFTAMIWKGVQKIGCTSNANGIKGCRYKAGDTKGSDTPNMGGSYTINVFAPARSFTECKADIETCFGEPLDSTVNWQSAR